LPFVPYFRSRIEADRHGMSIRYRSERVGHDGPRVGIGLEYAPAGPRRVEPGSFEHWATERYCLYTLDERQRVLRGDIHHPPWPLQSARAALGANTMGRQIEGGPRRRAGAPLRRPPGRGVLAQRGGRDPDGLTVPAAFETTEFFSYLVVLAGILIAGAVVDSSDAGGYGARQVWLYATILTVGYMVSRGLAKSGSSDPYDADDGAR
jgi:hypothetical protein